MDITGQNRYRSFTLEWSQEREGLWWSKCRRFQICRMYNGEYRLNFKQWGPEWFPNRHQPSLRDAKDFAEHVAGHRRNPIYEARTKAYHEKRAEEARKKNAESARSYPIPTVEPKIHKYRFHAALTSLIREYKRAKSKDNREAMRVSQMGAVLLLSSIGCPDYRAWIISEFEKVGISY